MKKLLIVDDDLILRMVMAESFSDLGYEVKKSANVTEAMEVLKKFSPTHALVDLKMPGPSGLELVAHLSQYFAGVKIVVLTGHASIETAVNAVKLGAMYYLAKPVDVARIEEAFLESEPSMKVADDEEVKDLAHLEREHIEQALIRNHHNVSQTARELGLHRRTLQRKLIKLGLESK